MENILPLLKHAESRQRGWLRKISGVIERDLAAFEAELGVRLPPTYREFLATMGYATGGVTLADGTRCDFPVIRKAALEGPDADEIRIAIGTEPAQDVFLSLSPEEKVRAGGDAGAETFSQLLYRRIGAQLSSIAP
jgi:hypothetical protein